MFPRTYTLALLASAALGSDVPWSADDCEVRIGYNLPQASSELSYPYSSWLLATCNGTESLLDLNECLGLVDGKLVPQDKGYFWHQHLGEEDCESCCNYDISDDGAAFTAYCEDNDTTSLPLNHTLTIAPSGATACLSHAGKVLNAGEVGFDTPAHGELKRSMAPNATAVKSRATFCTAADPHDKICGGVNVTVSTAAAYPNAAAGSRFAPACMRVFVAGLVFAVAGL
ncbi:hypothetical protein F5B20DRAFT_583462 [Whalleya microplaca]|nr:hypothetical protein F5B20DRAFT_583462 [Whalleya microplaca]